MYRSRTMVAGLVGVFAAVIVSGALASPAKLTAKPSNTSPPTISGTTQRGSTLTADHGNWNGATPINYQYQWRRCDETGGSCADISGQTTSTYTLKAVDTGNTLRIRVTASNVTGSDSATSVPTAVVTAAPSTPATGCPAGAGPVSVTDVSTPARLQVTQFIPSPSYLTASMSSFTLKVSVGDTCGQAVQGALVYATAVPFRQVTIPAETATGADGTVTLTFSRLAGYPATTHQSLMVLFIRARKPGDNVLAGITTGRLVSIAVRLH